MIEFLKQWVLNIVTLAIFIVLLEILIPSGKTKKFVNLVSGFVLIIALINPLLAFLGKKVNFKDFQITSSNFLDKNEIEQNSKILEEDQMKQIIEVYRKKIIRQLEENTKEVEGVAEAKADVIINDNYKSEEFGEIKRVYLYLSLINEKTDIKPVSRVEKVEISKNTEKTEPEEVSSELKTRIENQVVKLFQVGKDDIIISLQEN